MNNIILYGIPNCDTTKKAMQWLQKNNIAFTFHDYKLHGISNQKLQQWCATAGWKIILNKKSTTWRCLTSMEQNKIINELTAIALMKKNNSIIKRPIIEYNNALLIGFNEKKLNTIFK